MHLKCYVKRGADLAGFWVRSPVAVRWRWSGHTFHQPALYSPPQPISPSAAQASGVTTMEKTVVIVLAVLGATLLLLLLSCVCATSKNNGCGYCLFCSCSGYACGGDSSGIGASGAAVESGDAATSGSDVGGDADTSGVDSSCVATSDFDVSGGDAGGGGDCGGCDCVC